MTGIQKPSVSAVFVLEIGDIVGPMLAGWLARGHRVAAIVTRPPAAGHRFSLGARRRRNRLTQVVRRYLGGAAVERLHVNTMRDWDAIAPRLAATGADVLVCYGFPRLIPDRILTLFPNGGVNLHPTLLPHYRGPSPLLHLLVDDAYGQHGGVTLHRMTAAYDEGEVLAQIPLGERFWTSRETYLAGVSAAMRRLVVEVVPEVCLGGTTGEPQPGGSFPWATLQPGPLTIDSRWTSAKLRKIQSFLGSRAQLAVLVGTTPVAVAQRLMRLGPPTGRPPMRMPMMVSFDLADGRVLHLTMNRLARQAQRWQRGSPARVEIADDELELRRFGGGGSSRPPPTD